MRELEFKAWHEEVQEFLEGDTSNMFKWIEQGQSVKLVQYTGLKDINGAKIFEGDIVKWGHVDGYEEYRVRHAVVSLSSALQFECFSPNDHIYGWANFMYQCTDKAMEVIGNIYENPELIKAYNE